MFATPKRTASFCHQHGYSGRRTAQELLQRLRQAPAVALGELGMVAKGELALSLACTLSHRVEQIRVLSGHIEHHVGSFGDGKLFMCFPRAERVCELGSMRERFFSDEHLASKAGLAPITHASGKSKAIAFRFACNHRLRAALTCLADNSRHASAWAADVCARAKARGSDHPQAIRSLARVWLRVIWRAWQHRKPCDPAQHRGAATLLKTAAG